MMISDISSLLLSNHMQSIVCTIGFDTILIILGYQPKLDRLLKFD